MPESNSNFDRVQLEHELHLAHFMRRVQSEPPTPEQLLAEKLDELNYEAVIDERDQAAEDRLMRDWEEAMGGRTP